MKTQVTGIEWVEINDSEDIVLISYNGLTYDLTVYFQMEGREYVENCRYEGQTVTTWVTLSRDIVIDINHYLVDDSPQLEPLSQELVELFSKAIKEEITNLYQ